MSATTRALLAVASSTDFRFSGTLVTRGRLPPLGAGVPSLRAASLARLGRAAGDQEAVLSGQVLGGGDFGPAVVAEGAGGFARGNAGHSPFEGWWLV